MSILTPLNDLGVSVSLSDNGKIKLTSKDEKPEAVEFVRRHREAILAALSQTGTPGQCESCPAAGYWDHSPYAGQGLLCFHTAYYLHKSGRPAPCSQIRMNCPRKETP